MTIMQNRRCHGNGTISRDGCQRIFYKQESGEKGPVVGPATAALACQGVVRAKTMRLGSANNPKRLCIVYKGPGLRQPVSIIGTLRPSVGPVVLLLPETSHAEPV